MYQFNLCAGTPAKIASSGINIAPNNFEIFGALEIGPDNKIYLSKYGASFLGVIANPNNSGIACAFNTNGVFLNGKTTMYGLPTLFAPYIDPPPVTTPSFTSTVNCLNVSFDPPAITGDDGSSCLKGVDSLKISYQWDFDDLTYAPNNNTSDLPDPTHTYTEEGTYHVTLLVNYRCNSDLLQKDVVVKSCDLHTFAPNSFTPNGDNLNDEFTIYTNGMTVMQLRIFDRWGNVVFDPGQKNNPASSDPWNGRFKNMGDVAPLGVYVWKMDYTTFSGEEKSAIGHITLIR